MRIYYLFLLFLLFGCFNKIEVKVKDKTPVSSSLNVTNIKVVNNQFIITGANLNAATSINYVDNSTTIPLQIESKTNNEIIANGITNLTIAANKVLNFVISSASASSTFSVDFSLCLSKLGGKFLDCTIVPNDKDVLSYDSVSGKWKPRSINGLNYQGAWNANDPLPSAVSSGDYYIVSVANAPYQVGDWIVYNGTSFDQIDNSQAIVSVFGRTGAVTAQEGDYNLDKLFDVDLTTTPPVANQVLKYDGTRWIPGTVTAGSGGTVTQVNVTAPLAVTSATTTPNLSITQATTSTNGYLSSTDWNTFNNKQASITAGTTAQYYRGDKSWQTLDTSAVVENTNLYFTNARVLGVPLTGFTTATGAVVATDSILSAMGKLQGQINAKADSASFVDWSVAGVQTIEPTRYNLTTANRAVVTNGSGVPTASTITSTELGYLSGVTSNIQTQLNSVSTAAGAWTINGSDVYRASGNVGIGTSAPIRPITIKNNTTYTSILLDRTANTRANNIAFTNDYLSGGSASASQPFWYTGQFDSSATSTFSGTGDSYSYYIVSYNGSNNVANLAITPSGKVGIGTAAPAQKLSVAGTVESTSGGFKFPDGTTQTTAAGAGGVTSVNTKTGAVTLNSDEITEGTTNLYLTNARVLGIPLTGFSTSTSAITATDTILAGFGKAQGQLNTKADLTNVAQSITASNINTTTINGSSFVSSQWTTNGSDIYRNSGNVGIGTSAPMSALNVVGDIYGSAIVASGARFAFSTGSDLTNKANITATSSNFNFGICTNSTCSGGQSFLSINYNGTTNLYSSKLNLVTNGSATSPSLYFNNDSTTGLYTGGTGALAISTAGTERMRFDNSGNVGIGTTTPGQKLSVAGIVESTSGGFKFPDGTTQATASGASYITVGTFDGFSSNIFAGLNVGNIGTSTGTSNEAFGDRALYSLTSGIRNHAFGIYALNNVTSGQFNIGFGQQAGGNISTGNNNIAIGHGANVTDGTADNQINIGNIIYGYVNNSIGIGGVYPGMKFSVQGGNVDLAGQMLSMSHSNPFIRLASTNWIEIPTSNNMSFATASIERVRIDGSGYVGIGTASPQYSFHLRPSSGSFNGALIENNGSTATSPRLVLVDTQIAAVTSAPAWLVDNSNDLFRVVRQPNITTAGAQLLTVNSSGNAWLAGTLTQASDQRLKRNIASIDESLEKILSLNGVYYNWISADKDQKRQIGLIAQNVQKVFPEAVYKNNEGFLSVAYANLIAPVIESIKSLYRIILKHDKQLSIQSRKIASIEAENKKLKANDAEKTRQIEAMKNYICSKDPKATLCK